MIIGYGGTAMEEQMVVNHSCTRKDGGFTLIEVLVSIAIVGILVAIAIPAYSSFREKARVAQAKAELKTLQTAIEALANDTENWPGPSPVGVVADAEVWDLNSAGAGLIASGSFTNWNGPYVQLVKKDPWGSDYFFDPDYEINGVDYPVVGSFGPNMAGQNAYDTDDIYLVLPTL